MSDSDWEWCGSVSPMAVKNPDNPNDTPCNVSCCKREDHGKTLNIEKELEHEGTVYGVTVYWHDPIDTETMWSPLEWVKVVQTSSICPSQWDAWDADGTYYYVRYRWGCLQVDKGKVMGEQLFHEQIGGEFDGVITLAEVLERTGIRMRE